MKSIVYKKSLRMKEIFESLPEKTMELAKQADTSFCLHMELSIDRNNRLIISLRDVNGISVKEISLIESNYKKLIRSLLRNRNFLFKAGRVSIIRTIKDKRLTIEYEYEIGYRNTNNCVLWLKNTPRNIFYCFFSNTKEEGEKMRNYLEDLLEKCKKDTYLFDKEFPIYFVKTLLEIPKVTGLFRTNSEFRMLLRFNGHTRSGCKVYYAQNSFRFLLDDVRDTISEEIRKEFDNSPIKETIFQGIAQAIDKKFLQINVIVEERFEKPGVSELNPPMEIHVYIKFLDNTDYTLRTIVNKIWNGKEYRYFHI